MASALFPLLPRAQGRMDAIPQEPEEAPKGRFPIREESWRRHRAGTIRQASLGFTVWVWSLCS